jgi:hypothetical protein
MEHKRRETPLFVCSLRSEIRGKTGIRRYDLAKLRQIKRLDRIRLFQANCRSIPAARLSAVFLRSLRILIPNTRTWTERSW